jgi:hypothetical protein
MRGAGGQRRAQVVAYGRRRRRVEETGRDRHDAHPALGEIARRGKEQRDDPGLEGGVGYLADLPVERRDRRGGDAYASPVARRGLFGQHRVRGEAQDV